MPPEDHVMHTNDTRQRAPEQPPCDSQAEDALLSMCLVFPDRIGQLDLARDLYYPEHRVIWAAMVRIHHGSPELNIGEFWIALRVELCRVVCRGAVDHSRDRSRCDGFRYLQVLTCDSASPKDVGYWMARLERCTLARQLARAAAEQYDRSWHGDVEGAIAAAEAALSLATPKVIGMEIP